jgi:hypothetical protein
VELELVKAAEPSVTLGTIKGVLNSAELADSSVALFQQVQGTAPADYAVIDIGEGKEWLTSRLFIGVAMLQRMRGLKCVVFTERFQATDKRLVAVVPATQLRWALAARYPYLETALVRAYAEVQPTGDTTHIPEPSQVVADIAFFGDNGAIQPWPAQQLTKRFIEFLQVPPPMAVGWNQPRLPAREEWVPLRPPVVERAEYVTRPLLRTLLPESAFNACITESREQAKAKRILPVLEFTNAEFVAMVDSERTFLRLIDRGALLEELASQHAG